MKILVVMPFKEKHKEYIQEIGKGCEFVYSSIKDVTPQEVEDADIIFGNVPAPLMVHAKKVKWMQLNSAGADAYCKPGILTKDIYLTCSTGAYGLAVSEYLVTVSLMLARKMDLYGKNQTEHIWKDAGKIVSVWNSTTLIVGLGDIGGEYAKRMKALGSYVIGVRRNPSATCPDYLDELHVTEELDELIPRADYIILILPGTPETNNIMSAKRIGLMKDSAFLINAGRGNSVDAEALMDALNNGRIGGAALDVVPGPEPLPTDNPLWDTPRCIVTPHIAGKFFLDETFERVVKITGENLKLYLENQPEKMRNIVNWATGYRKR